MIPARDRVDESERAVIRGCHECVTRGEKVQ